MSEFADPETKPLLTLPADCLLHIFKELPPREVVRAKRVSKQWHKILMDSQVCRRLLQLVYPQSREVRLDMLHNRIYDLPNMPHNLRVEVECRAQQKQDWSQTFVAVARRYHNLQSGTPREYLKLPMPDMVDHTTLDDCVAHGWERPGHICPDCRYKTAQCSKFFWMHVPTWSRMFMFREHSQEYHYPDPMWWYSQEDALLVYPASWLLDEKAAPSVKWAEMERSSTSKDVTFRQIFNGHTTSCEDLFYRLFDPETGEHISVPFDVRGKVIRRVRLAHGVLILEWIQINADKKDIDKSSIEKNKAYRHWAKIYKRPWTEYLIRNCHMVTVFDVVRTPVSPDGGDVDRREWTWEVRLRYEWKLPNWGCGLPIQERPEGFEPEWPWRSDDKRPRFFSAHTATHYALFIWMQGRGIDTDRQLYVWDISVAQHGNLRDKKSMRSVPTLVRRMEEDDIRHHQNIFGLEVQEKPSLRNIAIDEQNVYLVHDAHGWAPYDLSGSQVGTHAVLSHGIPVIPFSPALQDSGRSSSGPRNKVSNPVFGPQSVDHCPGGYARGFFLESHERLDADAEPERFSSTVFCRHFVYGNQEDERLRSTPVMTFPPYSYLPTALQPSVGSLSYPWDGSDAASHPLQPRNFPGLTPCWRHENFPYVGISAVTDYAAGVRWVARDSRPLHMLTPRLKPTVTVNISGSRRLEDKVENVNGVENEHGTENDSGRWRRPRAALLNTARPHPPSRGPLTLDELRSRFHAHVRHINGDDRQDDDGEDDDNENHYCPDDHPNDFDPFDHYLDDLRHPFKLEPEPRNIRQDEVDVECSGFWENMMGRMTLAGDERWLIGQDSENRVTLVRF